MKERQESEMRLKLAHPVPSPTLGYISSLARALDVWRGLSLRNELRGQNGCAEAMGVLPRRYWGWHAIFFSPTNAWRAIRPRRGLRTFERQKAYILFIARLNWLTLSWKSKYYWLSFVRTIVSTSFWNRTNHLCRLKNGSTWLATGSPIKVLLMT